MSPYDEGWMYTADPAELERARAATARDSVIRAEPWECVEVLHLQTVVAPTVRQQVKDRTAALVRKLDPRSPRA